MNRKNILKSLLQVIEGFSDKEYQKRAWIKGEEADFGENVCLLSDLGDSLIENYKDFGIKEEEYRILKLFRDEFERFNAEHYQPELFLETPEWARIIKLAKEVLEKFNYPENTIAKYENT